MARFDPAGFDGFDFAFTAATSSAVRLQFSDGQPDSGCACVPGGGSKPAWSGSQIASRITAIKTTSKVAPIAAARPDAL